MKKIFILVFISMLWLPYLYAQKSDLTEIRSILDNQELAWNKGNITEFMKGYWNSDSLCFLTAKGLKKGYNTLLNHYLQKYPSRHEMGNLKFIILKIETLNAESAMVIGNWNLTNNENEYNGYFSLIFKKINGTWKIILDHTS